MHEGLLLKGGASLGWEFDSTYLDLPHTHEGSLCNHYFVG